MVVIKDPEIVLGEKIKSVFGEKDAEVYYKLMAERDCLAGSEYSRMFKAAKVRIEELIRDLALDDQIDDAYPVDESLLLELIHHYRSEETDEDSIVSAAVADYCEQEGLIFE